MVTSPPPEIPANLAALFDEAFETIDPIGEASFELLFEDLEDPNNDIIHLLFETVDETLVDPQQDDAYAGTLTTSDMRDVVSTDLNKELRQVEKATALPAFSLKGVKGTTGTKPQETPTYLEPTDYAPRGLEVFSALVVDSAIVLLIASLVGGYRFDGELSELLATIHHPAAHVNEAIGLLASILHIAGALALLYPLLCLLIQSATIGQRTLGMLVTAANGARPLRSQLILRTFAAPIGWLFVAPLTVMIGKRPLHESIAHTRTLKRSILEARAEIGEGEDL